MLGPLRRKLKSALLRRWNIPHSVIPDLPASVYERFQRSGPIRVVDVGAHRASFTLALQQLCGVSGAALVEPIAALARDLRADPRLAGFSVFDCLAADADGDRDFNVYENFPYISSALQLDDTIEDLIAIAKGEPKSIRRPQRRLDHLVNEAGLEQIDIIKIDVQGLEAQVIAGATGILDRTASLLVEVSFRPIYSGSAVFSDVYDQLYAHGFQLQHMEPAFKSKEGEYLQADALFARP
jgi:FkbM family methyltransferase